MSIPVRNPRTGAEDYTFEPPSRDELSGLAARLRAGQAAWEAAGLDARAEALLSFRDALAARRDEIIDALIADTGRRIETVLEVDAVLGMLERWCRIAPDLLAEPEPRPASIPTVTVRQGMHPYPLVGVISPWNFPLLLSAIDAVPALVAGCAVLIKPSEITPRFIEPVARAIASVPSLANVLAYVAGAGETGSAIVDLVDAVCFTGSVPTGRAVGEQAMARFIPAFLELGGKDPAIVLGSADLERATSAILWGGTANAGQSCLSIERVYVARDVFELFVELLTEKARAVRLAAPRLEDGEIGPIIAAKQVAVIGDHLADAFAKGAKARAGGELEEIGGGTYLRPTVLTDVDHTMKVMTAETFGPVLPVMPFDGVGEGVAFANDTAYGLSAAVFGAEDEALWVARAVRAGAISVNDAALTALVYDAEKNSFNLSGLGGSRMGPAALRRFGRRQAYLVADARAPDPWWYPQLRA